MIDSLILDVDGTLWDSTPLVAAAWTRAARECGLTEYEATADLLRGLFGKTMDVIALHMFPQESEEKRREIMALCCRYEHEVLAQDECRLCYPGVVETIRTLSGQIPVCIVSNCQAGYIELFIEKTGLGDCITDTECFGNNGKSKGENIRLVAERNGFAHPAYVGDIQGDCDASREAGVSFILAAYGFGTAEDPDWKIDTFSQLLPLIREEAAGTER